MEPIKMTGAEIEQAIDDGNLEVINGIAKQDGSVVQTDIDTYVYGDEQPSQPLPREETGVVPQNEVQEEIVEQPVEGVEEETETPENDPIEQLRKYNEHLESSLKTKDEDYSKRLAELEKKLEEQQRIAEEYKKTVTSPETGIETETDEFVSEYEKQTRQKIDELMNRLPDTASVDEIKQWKEEQRRLEEQRKYEEQINKTYNEVRGLQNEYSDLKTSKDIKDVDDEYNTFREQLATIFAISPNNREKLNLIESKYFDKMDGGKVFETVSQRGISPSEDISKFREFVKYSNLTRGIEIDPYTGQEKQTGVAYPSIKDAYRIKNFDKIMNSQIKSTAMEVQNKISSIANGAHILGNAETSAHAESGMTAETIEAFTNLSRAQLLKMDETGLSEWRKAWRLTGQEPPKILGVN